MQCELYYNMFYTALLCLAPLYSILLYSTLFYSTVPHYIQNMQYCAEQPCARTSCIILLVFFSDSENVILTFFPNETVHIWLHIPLCLDGAKTDPLCLYIYVGYWLISTIHNICKYVLVMERKSTILHLSLPHFFAILVRKFIFVVGLRPSRNQF